MDIEDISLKTLGVGRSTSTIADRAYPFCLRPAVKWLFWCFTFVTEKKQIAVAHGTNFVF